MSKERDQWLATWMGDSATEAEARSFAAYLHCVGWNVADSESDGITFWSGSIPISDDEFAGHLRAWQEDVDSELSQIRYIDAITYAAISHPKFDRDNGFLICSRYRASTLGKSSAEVVREIKELRKHILENTSPDRRDFTGMNVLKELTKHRGYRDV